MASFAIPEDGLTFLRNHHDDPSGLSTLGSTQIMRLSLAQQATERILKTLRNAEQAKVRFGKRVSLEYGKTVQQLQSSAETHSSELFFGSVDRKEQFYFSGKASHALEAQKAQKAVEQTDSALATLQSTLKSMQEQRASNETSFVTNRDDLKQSVGNKKGHKPSPLLSSKAQSFRRELLGGITHSTPSSPFLAASFSPSLGPTSAPLLSSSAPSKDKIRLNAIKIPLIHLLAASPMTPNNVAKKLCATKEDCENLLDKCAEDSRQAVGKKELKEKAYKHLDPWKFPYPSQDDRQAAIDRAIRAFDRMRVGRSDNLWQLLLPEERRGRGECLSKLSFDQPGPIIKPPRLVSDQSLLSAKGDFGNEHETDTERGRLAPKVPASKDRTLSQNPLRRKSVSEKEAVSKQHMKKNSLEQPKISGKTITKPGKPKYKSAEVIVDSDEETDEVGVAPSRASTTIKEKASNSKDTFGKPDAQKAPLSPMPKKPHPEFQTSQSSSSDTGTTAIRTNQTLKPHSRSKNESTTSRLSPRPHKGSSPHKPSPLASSPPTNANDPDTSTSSKSSDSSTAASSPPSSSDLRKQKDAAASLSREEMARTTRKPSAKRKADTSEDLPTTKRQQVNGISHTQSTNIETSDLNDNNTSSDDLEKQRPFPIQRPSTDSEADSVSSEEKARLARIALIENARKFPLYYARYKKLHDQVSSQENRDRNEVEKLIKMHNRLADMKQEVWDEWERLGKPDLETFEGNAISMVTA